MHCLLFRNIYLSIYLCAAKWYTSCWQISDPNTISLRRSVPVVQLACYVRYASNDARHVRLLSLSQINVWLSRRQLTAHLGVMSRRRGVLDVAFLGSADGGGDEAAGGIRRRWMGYSLSLATSSGRPWQANCTPRQYITYVYVAHLLAWVVDNWLQYIHSYSIGQDHKQETKNASRQKHFQLFHL